MPPKLKRMTLAEFHAAGTFVSAEAKPNGGPLEGEIWWAVCSIRQAVLDVIHEFSLTPPSVSMVTDRQILLYNGLEKRARPCIVMRVVPQEGLVVVVPMTTFGGSPIQTVDGYTKDLSISVDNTPPWPIRDSSHVIRTTPSWPLSNVTPCYAISHACTLSYSDVIKKYVWPVATGAEVAGGTTSTNQRPAPKASKPISLFTLKETRRLQLLKEITTRKKRIQRKTVKEAQAANRSWDERRLASSWGR